MGTAEIIYLLLFLLCLLLSAFFSSSETAFISLQKFRIKHRADTEGGTAKEVDEITKKPERLLTTILLGNNLVNTAAAALATAFASSLLTESWCSIVAATAVVTILLLIFGEISPKIVATRHGEKIAFLYTAPMKMLIWILYPLAFIFIWIADKLANLLGASDQPQTIVSKDEIRTAVSVGKEEGTLEQAEATMVERVFRFGDRQVNEVMTPRPDIIWVEKGTTLSAFLNIFADSPHSRFPMYEDTIDNIFGILWIKDILMAQSNRSIHDNALIDQFARPAFFIPETKLLAELFTELQESSVQMAMIIDEFGGTVGLVTMEQLLEEIVGEFGDELAKGREIYEPIDDNNFHINGAMRIDDINEQLSLGIPDGEYETVAGFVLSKLGHIPKEGEQIKYNNLKMVITEMKGVKIDKILVTRE